MSVPLQAETRPTLWRIGEVGEIVFYYLAAVAIAVFLYGVYDRFARYARGTEDAFERLNDLPRRVREAARLVGSNEKQFDRDLLAGVMHAFVLWGFLTLLIGTTVLAIELDVIRPLAGSAGPVFFAGEFYLSYSFVMDAMGLLFVVGVGLAIYRRYWARSDRLDGKHTGLEDHVFLGTLFLLGVGGYVTEAVRILGTGVPDFEAVSFVGYGLALGLRGLGMDASLAAASYPAVWWLHSLLALFFVAYIPYAKPFHMISSFANVVTRDENAGVRLPGVPADLDADSGAESIDSFSWRELLDQDACTKCGRCSSVCPADASGRPLDPQDVILDLKEYRERRDAGAEPEPIVADGGGVIHAETMESCMACMACMDACPVEIEHLKSFTKMNRTLVDGGDVPPAMQEVFRNVMRTGNTFGESQRSRGAWTDDLAFEVTDAREEAVDYLWYVGDYPSYDDRNREVARSLARLLQAADVSFGVLFDDEKYDGNDLRRVGEEFLYVELAGHHVETFEDCEFDSIVCTDPHSYNTFKNEYPEVDFADFADDPVTPFDHDGEWNADGAVDVLHWTQAVEELVADGALDLRGDELDYTVTYHDPCHLGRMNDEYEAPRELIRATGCHLVEMPRNRADSYCCGGGGGGLWLDNEQDEKPSEERLREALEDTAGDVEKFVVACPMCMTMYEDGRKTGGYEDAVEIVDVSELLVEAVETREPTATGPRVPDTGDDAGEDATAD